MRVKESIILVLDNIGYLNTKVHLLATLEALILKVLYNLNSKFYLISLSIDDQINIARNQFLKTFNKVFILINFNYFSSLIFNDLYRISIMQIRKSR